MSYQDSNLDKQNQNLMCYHYTIGQSVSFWGKDSLALQVLFAQKRVQKYDFFTKWQNLFSISLI